MRLAARLCLLRSLTTDRCRRRRRPRISIRHGWKEEEALDSDRIELSWLLNENFFDMVSEIWNKEKRGNNNLQKWQNKIRRLKQFLRGWAINLNGAYRKEKEELLRKTNELDKKAEDCLLSQQEMDLKQCLKERLAQLLREEEIR